MEAQNDFLETTQEAFRAFMSRIRIAIVYHSGYGHTRRQAEARENRRGTGRRRRSPVSHC